MRVFMFPAQDMRVGGRQSDSQYQFTLWSADLDELQKLGAARSLDRVKQVAGRRSTSPPTASRAGCRPMS